MGVKSGENGVRPYDFAPDINKIYIWKFNLSNAIDFNLSMNANAMTKIAAPIKNDKIKAYFNQIVIRKVNEETPYTEQSN